MASLGYFCVIFGEVYPTCGKFKATDGLCGILMKAKILERNFLKGLCKVFNHFLLRSLLVMTVGVKEIVSF